jgi:hypothetical protein
MSRVILGWSSKQLVFSTLCILVVISTADVFSTQVDAQEFRSIFNGKDLSTSKKRPLPHNQFLIWDGTVADFEFKAEFRLIGENNSGVQYRSQVIEGSGDFRIKGYQADIHSKASYTGMLYDEGGRGIVAQRGQRVVVTDKGEKNVVGKTDPAAQEDLTKWTSIEIRAVGNRLIHLINGKVTVDITDQETKNQEFKGLLALQIHAGKPMVIQFRKLQLRELVPTK